MKTQIKIIKMRAENERKIQEDKLKAKYNNETIMEVMDRGISKLYRQNLKNVITKTIDVEKFNKKRDQMFSVSNTNKAMKVTQDDVDMLKRYEKLLYNQNERTLKQLQTQGFQTIKPRDKRDLQEILDIKAKKKYLISRMEREKEEQHLREIEDQIEGEVNRGVRRSKVIPPLVEHDLKAVSPKPKR